MVSEIGRSVVRRWLALVGAVATVVSVAAFAISKHQYWAWLAILALVLLVVALGWTLVDMRKSAPSAPQDLHSVLRPLLSAAATRLDHVGGLDPKQNPKWVLDQAVEQSKATYTLVDASLGPKTADEFSRTQGVRLDSTKGVRGIQSDMTARAAFVRGLVDTLDSRPIMGDWQP